MGTKEYINRQIIDLLKEELQKPLPGRKAQLKMFPASRQSEIIEAPVDAKNGAVLVMLYLSSDELTLCFIKRAENGGNHSGQISFPGGKIEKTDKDIIDTALRETEEEIGVSQQNIHILGNLTSLYIPVSNYLVSPVVAYNSIIPTFELNRTEVDDLLEIPLSVILNGKNCKSDLIQVQNKMYQVPVYDTGNYKIWGATAMILSEFIEVYRKVEKNSLIK